MTGTQVCGELGVSWELATRDATCMADYTVKGGKQVDNVLKRMSISHLSHVKEDEKLYRCH